MSISKRKAEQCVYVTIGARLFALDYKLKTIRKQTSCPSVTGLLPDHSCHVCFALKVISVDRLYHNNVLM